MSVIQKIQERQKWVFGTIAFALIIFVVQDKFMSKGSLFGNPTNIAKVNGESIEYTDFESQKELMQKVEKQQQQDIDDDQLNTYTYDNLITKALLKQECAKLGLVYTNNEFGDAVGGTNPPDWFRQQYSDPQTGVYNGAEASSKFADVISQIKKHPNDAQAILYYDAIIQPTYDAELAKKYQALVNAAIYVPKWMAEKNNADNSSDVNISYVNVPYTTIVDSTIKVSDDEISDYLKAHTKEFEQKEEARQVAYVTFDAAPSHADTTAVIDKLNGLKKDFQDTKDITSFMATQQTEIPYSERILGKTLIQQPMKDTLFKLQVGELFGPYRDVNNFVIAKLVEERQFPDSVKVRHILVETAERTQQGMSRVRDDSAAMKRLDSAIALIKAGKSWDSVCIKYSDDPGSKFKGGQYDYIGDGGPMVQSFTDSAFYGKVGDKKIVKSEFGYHYMEIMAAKGSQPAYNFAYLAKPITQSEETDEAAKNDAAEFAGTSHDVKDFYANAGKLKKTPIIVLGIKAGDYQLSGPQNATLGKNRQFIRWVYDNSVGDISTPFAFGQKYLVAIITAVDKPGLPSPQTARPMVETRIRNEKKAKLISAKMKGNTLEAIAQSSGSTVKTADSLSFRSKFIPGAGAEDKVIGASFNKEWQNKITPPIAGEFGVFVVKSSGVFGVMAPQGNVDMQRKNQELSLKRSVSSSLQNYEALHKAADISDNRGKLNM